MTPITLTFQFATIAAAAAFLAANSGNAMPVAAPTPTPTPTAAPIPPAVAPTPAVSVAAPAPAAAGAIDPFGDMSTIAAPTVTPMALAAFSDALKALCTVGDVNANRTKLTAFLASKGAATVGALATPLSDDQRGALFLEAKRALA